MKHYVDGKVVVITGGTSGFGLETARNCFIQETRIWGTAQVPEMVNPF